MKPHLRLLPCIILSVAIPLSAQPLDAPAPAALTLSDAVRLAIQNNLTIKLAKAGTQEARGQALQAAAGLLPRLIATASQARVFKVNLQAEGFPANLGLFPSLIGPFNTFDARFRLAENFLDLNAWWTMEAGRANKKVAEQQEHLAREQVAAAAALAYITAQRNLQAVAAAQADVKLADSLLRLAQDQRKAGISTGIDVARADTSSAQQRLKLIRTQVAAQQSDLALKRVVGLPLGQPLQLAQMNAAPGSEAPQIEPSISAAQQTRFEILLAKDRLEVDQLSLQAARAANYPVLSANADYGYSGTTPDNVARTGSIGGAISLPIFNGGATHGATVAAQARAKESEDRYNDVRVQVEEDVRLAIQTLQAERDEVTTANQAVDLAQKELTMARDRFAAGVGDNIQLLTAQDSLDRALDDQVDALSRYATARVNFATALGQAEHFQ